MTDTASLLHGVQVLSCAADGPPLVDVRSTTDLIGTAFEQHAELVVLPTQRLGDGFFTLSTGLAGEILQKFVTYRLRVAIVGDLTAHLGASPALQAFVRESNRGHQVWFATDLAEVEARLARKSAGPPAA